MTCCLYGSQLFYEQMAMSPFHNRYELDNAYGILLSEEKFVIQKLIMIYCLLVLVLHFLF